MTDLLLSYEKLLARYKELMILQSTESLVRWDMETKMPPRGVELRSQQLSQLSKFEHQIATDPEIGALLEKVERHQDRESLNQFQTRNVHLIRKNYNEQTRLPEKLVVETERQRTLTINTWKKAKAAKEFSLFRPELERLFDLRKQAAEILMEAKSTRTPYDALIDIYEPRITSDTISRVFNELRDKLAPIVEKFSASHVQPDTSILKRIVPIRNQEEVSKAIAQFIGYDVISSESGGRIDETEHPFTSGYYDDVRITTHYYEDNVASSIFSVLHEGGHAKYEEGLRRDWMYQPVGACCSYGFHESQSRFVENMVGRSTEFWEYFLPPFKSLTGEVYSDVRLDEFVRAVNQIRPSKIRIEADEVTYSLHIIIRFELERALFEGKITIPELPEAWNEKYLKYLGQRIENDTEGVMQDTHWAGGDFGYFPSYALGNVYGGQILSTMTKDVPDWRDLVAEGSYHKIGQWLTENLYSCGNLYDPLDLLKKISGEAINVSHFIDYLDSKYSALYGY